MLGEALGERGQAAELGERRDGVRRPVLHRPELGGRPDVPADLAGDVDHPALEEVLGVVLELGPGVHRVGQAVGGELLEQHGALGGEEGVLPLPVRRGAADCQ
ncbi:hypothetical protein SDC9_195771 [bioreactor metagenome]|uniref:Uncharacterized protein n=1 Tax=bioreactor metagenome TaxID=1076179 RepID=A0A645IB64_9ZZZZ